MVSYALIHAKAAYGYAKVAQTIGGGTAYAQYRATAGTPSPLSTTPINTALQAIFSSDPGLTFAKPDDYANPKWYGAWDQSSVVQPWDYLVGQQGTFFVAAMAPVAPFSAPMCILCNRTASFVRPAAPPTGTAGFGAQPYGGVERATETALATGWPCYIGTGTKGESNTTALPADVRAPWVDIRVAAIPGVTLKLGDQVTDDLGVTYTLSSVELSHLGYRITAAFAGT